VTARGVERRRIFVDDVDRTRFLSQRQIGRLLHMGTVASVSAHLRRLERAIAADPKLQARCTVIDSRLNVDC